ncbi:MAG: NHL domain-containing protein [Mucilaginibacter sp.]
MMKKLIAFFVVISCIKSNSQNISTLAGNGSPGYSGDGGFSTSAKLNNPVGIGSDTSGNIYIADDLNFAIRKIAYNTGIISTICGTGVAGYTGDGGLAINAKLNYPGDVACDKTGNLYIADQQNNVIRKITISTGIITTIAGNGSPGYTGDGGLATSAQLKSPLGVAIGKSGNLYIADANNDCIRKVNTSTGIITTIAGNGSPGFSGDGGPAVAALVKHPSKIALDTTENIYFCDEANNRIRKIIAGTGIIQTIAGSGSYGYSGDGGPAIAAEFSFPIGIDLDAAGNIYIADLYNNRIRKIMAATNIIITVAGNGTIGYSGDGGLATSAQIYYPEDVLLDKLGNFYFPEYSNHVLRKVGTAQVSVRSLTNDEHMIKIYPNPNNGSFKVQIDNEIGNGEIFLINSIGQKVHGQKISQGQNNIITSGLATGLYNYIILRDKGQIGNGKLTVE